MQVATSDGLWALAWKRFKRDRIGMGSMVVVFAFFLLCLASGLGLVGSEWWMEKGVNYARPVFAPGQAQVSQSGTGSAPVSTTPQATPSAPVVQTTNADDPLAGALNEIRGGTGGAVKPTETKPSDVKSEVKSNTGKGASSTTATNSDDPLASVLGEIRSDSSGTNNSVTPTNAGSGPVSNSNSKGADSPKVQSMNGPKAQLLPFGGDKWGRDVLSKAIKGAETSLLVGFAAALVATVIGTLLGAFAGYHGGRIDDFLNWFYSIFSAIPYILLVLAIAAVLQSKGVLTVVLILGLTGWTTVFRLVRAEYMKHKSRDYVRAADAIGASDSRRMFVHILPNVSHVILVNLSLLVVGFIKSEVILSYLGFGVPVDTVSWGSMLNESQNELILGYWWQLLAATLFMGVLVTAFSLFTDSMRDALDPKLK